MLEKPVSSRQSRQRRRPGKAADSARMVIQPLKGHRLPLVYWVGLLFLIILLASVIFEVLQPELRVIYVIGIAAGLGAVILKSSGLLHSGSPQDRINITPIQVLLVIPILFMLLIVYFAGFDVLIWLAGNQSLQRFLTLGLGIVFGVGIEICLARTLWAIKNRSKAY